MNRGEASPGQIKQFITKTIQDRDAEVIEMIKKKFEDDHWLICDCDIDKEEKNCQLNRLFVEIKDTLLKELKK